MNWRASTGLPFILKKALAGEILVLDVRPAEEFASTHLPHARSLPLEELKKRLGERPKDLPVVAYCRGPSCLIKRMGRRRVLLLGWLVALPVPLVVYFATSWTWIVVATILLGVNQG
ncbi:MAG: hypothetical protein MUP33_07205, partial [Polaromonas sp.]|nr:hypothetical protein [Polaromonas sp.]